MIGQKKKRNISKTMAKTIERIAEYLANIEFLTTASDLNARSGH